MLEALQKNGITVEVRYNGKTLEPAEDGYLGEMTEGKFRLKCFAQRRDGLMPICFLVDGQKNVAMAGDHSRDPNVRLFAKKVPVEKLDSGVFTTKSSTNNSRLVIFGAAGRFEVWEIAIVSQDGFFFLTEQMTYVSQFFRGEDDRVLCPEFEEKWPQLIEMLRPVMEKQELSPISTYVPSPAPKAEGLQKQQGKVLWWSSALQMGLLVLDEKGTVARVHWKNLPPSMNGSLRKLEAGQLVSFQKLLPISKSGTRDSTILLEAREVIPI